VELGHAPGVWTRTWSGDTALAGRLVPSMAAPTHEAGSADAGQVHHRRAGSGSGVYITRGHSQAGQVVRAALNQDDGAVSGGRT
jgi:hypothetical protein